MEMSSSDLSVKSRKNEYNESKFLIFGALHQHPEGLTAKQLSALLHHHYKTCTSLLQRYKRFGYIYSRRNPYNLKEYVWCLAPTGVRVYNYLLSIHIKNMKITKMRNDGLPAMGGNIESFNLDKYRPDYWKRKHPVRHESNTPSPERVLELEEKYRAIQSSL